MPQEKQNQWAAQWKAFSDNEEFLFEDWIFPNSIKNFEGKSVLECGCGGGQHTSFIASVCQRIVAVDLNSVEVAKKTNRNSNNIEYVEEDIAKMQLGEVFDIVYSIGVIHHTDNPDETVHNIISHIRPGGRIIVWVYSLEGNWIAKNIVERFRQSFLSELDTKTLIRISKVLTALMYFPIYTVYKLPLKFLPYYSYFTNFRKLNFNRNTLNVFDKLNAPQVEFISRDRVVRWFSTPEFSDVYIGHYKGVGWRASATLNPR